MKKITHKNQIMITALAIMIGVAGYLNFAGTKIGREDFLSFNGSDKELTYEMSDISDEDMYAVSLNEEGEGIASLDTDNIVPTDNYLSSNMEITGKDVSQDALEGLNSDSNQEIEVPGEAVFTSTTALDTLAGAKLIKEQTRAKNKDTLMEIINNEELTESAKKDAINAMISMTDIAQKETDAQMLLEAKGYKEAVVSISDGTCDVMIGATKLSDAQTAQIMDIVQRKTDISPDKIVITVSGS